MSRIDVSEQAVSLAVEEAAEIDSGNPEQPIVLCRTDDGLFAVSGICTHAYARLVDGYVLDKYIECPLHQAQFDLTNGQRVSGPECDNLVSYSVHEDSGRVFIELAPDS